MSETERKLARKAREIAEEHARIFSTLQMVDKHVWMPQINGRDEHDSSTKLTDEQVEGLRNYIRRLKKGEIDSNLDDYRAMPEDNKWQGNIFPSNPGVKPEVDHVTKALGKFAFDFLVGDVITILDPDALTEDKLIAAAMMLPPAKVVKLAAKLKDLEKMKDTIDHLDDVSDKVKDSSDNLQDVSKGGLNSISESALKHSSEGDFTLNPKTGEISKMKGGGHGQANVDFLEQNGIEYNIEKLYENGVRVGNVPSHKIKAKRTGTNQSWFPESWNETDISKAGEYVGNLPENINVADGLIGFGEYNGVRVGVIRTDGKISTVFPDATIQP